MCLFFTSYPLRNSFDDKMSQAVPLLGLVAVPQGTWAYRSEGGRLEARLLSAALPTVHSGLALTDLAGHMTFSQYKQAFPHGPFSTGKLCGKGCPASSQP